MFHLPKVHPFPARMASDIVWKRLQPAKKKRLLILDPMAGSGTTLATARVRGHIAVGFDTDPLAILLSKVWCSDVNKEKAVKIIDETLLKAKEVYRGLSLKEAYPDLADDETRSFIRFWFDDSNRRQLTALGKAIKAIKDKNIQSIMWCAFSRLIITKNSGVSLAMDISHSRPHKVYDQAPVRAFDQFSNAARSILKSAPFDSKNPLFPKAIIRKGDARRLPLENKSVDMVITSPPYLNAIDYLRGHKLSLVWMGYTVSEIRKIRSTNIGTERANKKIERMNAVLRMGEVHKLSDRVNRMLEQYVSDMSHVLSEIKRVLVWKGNAVLVVGDSTIQGVYIRNSQAIKCLAQENGFFVKSMVRRPLPENRRYLPPPSSKLSGVKLAARMREEVLITLTS